MNKLLVFLLLTLVIGCSTATNVKKDISLKELVKLHNQARLKWNYDPLIEDSKLTQYANNHANFMLKSNRLKHSNIGQISKLGFSMVGENIAWNQQTEEEVMSSWMWSPGHRSNILGKGYDSIGCGVAYDKNNIYWCVVFGEKFKSNYSK
jgi:uncharacterized protein YkwD